MKITTYNIRGLGGGVKWSSVHRIVVKDQEDLLCIQETKRDRVDKWACQALWEDSEICWAESPAINNAGGMLCLWNESTFSVERKIIGTGFVVLDSQTGIVMVIAWQNVQKTVHPVLLTIIIQY